MVFSWSVILAHEKIWNIITKSNQSLKLKLSQIEKGIPLMHKSHTTFYVIRNNLLFLVISDGISRSVKDWEESWTSARYETVRTVLSSASLPIKINKSLPFDQVEQLIVPFEGMELHLKYRTVLNAPKKSSIRSWNNSIVVTEYISDTWLLLLAS